MAELQFFEPGKTFYDSFRQSRGNSLAGLAMNSQGEQRQSALAQLAGIDAGAAASMKKGLDDQDRAELAEFSNVILTVPDELKPQVYAKGVQRFGSKFRDLGIEPPADYTQAMPLFQQFAGGGKDQGFTGAPILIDTPEGPRYARYNAQGITATDYAPADNYKMFSDPQTGEVSGYGSRTNRLVPTAAGGQAQAPSLDAGDPMQPHLDRINSTVQAMKEANMPVEQINAWADNAFAKAQQQVSSTGVTTQQAPQQARVSVKPVEQKVEIWGEAKPVIKNGRQVMLEKSNLGNERERPDLSPPVAATQSLDATKAKEQRAALRQDAINFAAAWLGKSPEEVSGMSPDAIRKAMKETDRLTAGPIAGSIWGMGKVANSDLEAYSSSAAAKVARINNPSGPVTEGDFRAAEKGIFSATKPKEVNADLVYQALTGGGSAPQQQPTAAGGQPVQIRTADDYNQLPSGAQYLDPNGKLRVKK
jgi:hypothetical protein